jgi:tripartite motif-containing protein 71
VAPGPHPRLGVPLRPALLLAALAAFLIAVPSALTAPVSTQFTGSVSATGVKFKTHAITVTEAGTITATLDWSVPGANLSLFLTDPAGVQVKAVTGTAKPKTFSFPATATGVYKVGVKAIAGSSAYTLDVSYPGAAQAGSGLVQFQKAIGFSGSAGLYAYGMDWDPTDNTILVGDYWNYRVWRYTTDGVKLGQVSQHALDGVHGGITAPYDVEADPTDVDASGKASVWVADQGSSRIVQFTHNGAWLQTIGKTNAGESTGTDAAHPGAAFAMGCGAGAMQIPTHVLVDTVFASHLIYASDPRCRQVYIFDHKGAFKGQLDWTGSGLGQPIPRGVAEDAAGNIIVAEFNSRRIFFFDPATRKIKGSIPAQGDMNDVRGLDVDPVRNLIYTVGAFWNRVYQFSYDPARVAAGTGAGSVVGSFANEWRNVDGTNYANNHQSFDSIRFPAVDGSGNVYVGETWGCDASCTGTPYGYGVEKFAPGDIAAKPACDVSNATTAQASCAGATALPWATGPQPPPRGGFNQQNGIAIDPADHSLFVVDTFEQRVQKFDTALACDSDLSCPGWLLQWGSREPANPNSKGLGYPRALTFEQPTLAAPSGRVWVGDNNNAVITFNPDGSFVHRFGSQGGAPGQFMGGVQGVRVEGGRVYTTDVASCRLQIFDEAKLLAAPSIASDPSALLGSYGSCGSGANQMTQPRGIAVDAASNVVYVAETLTSRISRWNLSTGTATTVKPVCGGKPLAQPWDITWDPARTWLYIGDVKNARIVRWSPSTGACQVVATSADLPSQFQMLGSNYIAFDGTNTMYVSDNARHVYVFNVTG